MKLNPGPRPWACLPGRPEEVGVMTTMTDEREVAERAGLGRRLLVLPELWGAIAIAFMWLAVLFDGIYGGDVTSVSTGTQSTTIPSAVFVALFACIGTASVAKRAFRRAGDAS
jgi:hypothetical protein